MALCALPPTAATTVVSEWIFTQHQSAWTLFVADTCLLYTSDAADE